MATGNKRPRHADDVDGDEEVEIESASSSFRQSTNKRTKVAVAQARLGSSTSDTSDDPDLTHFDDLLQDQDEGVETDVGDDTEYSLRHYGDDEDEEDEVDEIKATQIVKKQLNRHQENMPMDEGIIEEVFCRNFMCHSKLRITLGPLINFIVGHNGSGKSAVLTALTMCLGGKATQTNRGASLKSLIKEGQESATLSVKIKNRGENAYKPQEYGKSIIVERNFNRSGTSGFKIRNEHGKEISKKKSELDDILDFFSLQLDNPINVLTQDMARQFLSNSSPADKYKFFIRGTNLETLDSDYKIFEDHLDGVTDKLRIREGDIAQLEQKRNQAEQRKKRGERTAHIHQRLREAQRQHAWAQVEEQEGILQRYAGDVETQESQLREAEEGALTTDTRFEAAETAKEAAQRAVEQHQEQLRPATEAHAAHKQKFDDNKGLIMDAQTEQRNIRESIKAYRREVTRLNGEVDLEHSRLSEQSGSEHSARLQELEQLEAQVKQAKVAEQDGANRGPDLGNTLKEAEERSQTATAEKEQASKQLATVQASLRELQREQGTTFGPYLPNMDRLCRAIVSETRWRSKPVGPIGLHVHLLKPKWSDILEKTFGGSLDAFVVSCKDDQNIFSDIARKVNCNASVFITSSSPMDTSGKEPEDDVDTMLRIMRIDEDAVRNVLIINHFVDQTVLIEDSQEASDYMQKRPKNVKATMTFGATRGWGIRYDLSRSGAYRSGPIPPWKGPTRMKTDRDEQKQILQGRVNEATREADAATQRQRDLLRDVEKAKQAITRHKREQVGLKTQRQKAEDDVEAKKADIESHRPQDGKLQELERQLEEAKGELRTAEDAFQDSVESKVKLDDIAKDLKVHLDAAQAELTLANDRVQQAEAKLKKADADRNAMLLEKNAGHDNVATAKAHVVRLEARRDEQQEKVDTFIREASKVSERVAVEENVTPEMFDSRIDALRAQYEQEQRRNGGSPAELTRLFTEAEMEYLVAKRDMKEMEEVRKKLKETLQERHRRWGLFRKYISARAKINFSYLLSEREFRGRVLLNHDSKELDISVEPDMARQSDAGRQAKTLSGGEKSFSTICLLLSIWEAMGSPIRCLDEFDVFMDSVNRAQSMSLMIQTARRSVGRQFILITPQSMQNVQGGDDVRIYKMSDPERGQQTLTFNGLEL